MEPSPPASSDSETPADCPPSERIDQAERGGRPHEAPEVSGTFSRIVSSAVPLRHEPLRWTDRPPERSALAVVGGGFSGLMTAIHTLRANPRATAVVFERLPRSRPGVAYGGADEAHLLNVRADRMGLTSAEVGGFAAWLEERYPGRFAPTDFVRRQLFGDFLNERVRAMIAPLGTRLSLVRDGVESIARGANGMTLRLASGATVVAHAVALALGLPVPGVPWAGDGATAVDPWSPNAFDGLDRAAPVLVIGTGLTALDVLVSLSRREHRGPITFVSRHGHFPLPHSEPSPVPSPITVDRAEIAAGPRRALREVRRAAAHALAVGRPWQEAIDAVRPHTTAVWQSWDDAARERFLARIRPFWEIHRHRAPVPVLQLLDAGRRAGRIETLRGTVGSVARDGDRWSVTIRTARGETLHRAAARVFNCIGPAMRLTENPDPLMRSLREAGLVSTDAAAIGLRADADGRAIDASGAACADLFVLGALRRGDLWESTAVPELRTQAERVSAALSSFLTGNATREESIR